jgi:predicted outer membrane protein
LSRVLSVAALVVLAICPEASAQSTSDATSAPLDGDRAEVATIVMHSVGEVKLCGLASQRSQNADVRSLCRKASADSAHAAIAGMQLAQRLGASGVKLQSSPQTSEALDALAQYSGQDFDRKFLLKEIDDGSSDEQDIRYAAEVAADTSVKSFENGVLPKIEDRVELAEGALRRMTETP